MGERLRWMIVDLVARLLPGQCTVAKIQASLVKAGARGIAYTYDDGGLTGMSFVARAAYGEQAYTLPANVEKVRAVLQRQKVPVRIGGRRSVDWVVVGGESGPGARPMHPEWARLLREQCRAARVPFYFKQRGDWTWSEHSTYLRAQGTSPRGFLSPNGEWTDVLPRVARLDRVAAMYRVGKHAAGRELDGRTWDEFPESWARLSREADAAADAPGQAGGS